MFYFFVSISFLLMITLVIFSIIYINKLESKLDILITSFDEMDLIDISSIEKKKEIAIIKNMQNNRNVR